MQDEDNARIMEAIGKIEGKLEAYTQTVGNAIKDFSNNNTKTTLALIGVIAAQIGVKVLGSDPYLDIATTFGILGVILVLGVLIMGVRRCTTAHFRMTKPGYAMLAMLFFIALTQVLVYCRDVGWLEPRLIYMVRIPQNISIAVFAWFLLSETRLVIKK